MKTTLNAPRPTTPTTTPPAAAPRPSAPPAVNTPVDSWTHSALGRERPDDQRAELRAFAPVAAQLARARAAKDVRPVFVEALELYMLSSRLASYAFRGDGPTRYDATAAARELDGAERNPVTNVLAFLAGGKKLHHLSEKEIARTIGVGHRDSIYDATVDYVAAQRAHLEGRHTPSTWASSSPALAAPRRDEGPLASVLGVRVFVEGATSGPFRDTRSGVQKWIDEGPL